MANYVVTYTPLALTRTGREAAEKHGHPPYADASCRRTPDFEATLPSISAVCRGPNFAPRLRVGDTVAYLTKKGRYAGHSESHWRLVAVLRVKEVFPTHRAAADWHQERNLPLPSDCIVPENPPLPADHTEDPGASIQEWDGRYKARTSTYGTFAVTEPLWMDLYEPRVVSSADMLAVFGGIPPTRTPPATDDARFGALLRAAGVKADGSRVKRPKTPARPDSSPAPNGEPPSRSSRGLCRGKSAAPVIKRGRCS